MRASRTLFLSFCGFVSLFASADEAEDLAQASGCLSLPALRRAFGPGADAKARQESVAKGLQLAQELLSSRDEELRLRAFALIAQGQPSSAATARPAAAGASSPGKSLPDKFEAAYRRGKPLLAPYAAASPGNFQYPAVLGYVENVRVQLREGQRAQAARLLEAALRPGKSGEGAPDPAHAPHPGLPHVLVVEARGDLALAGNELEAARDLYREARSYGRAWFAPRQLSGNSDELAPALPGAAAWPPLDSRLTAKLLLLARSLRARDCGMDFALYAEARELQAAGLLAFARETWDELLATAPDGIYGEAARFYRCLCYAADPALKDRDQAEAARREAIAKELQAYLKLDAQGLYAGDALYQLGSLALTGDWDVKKAQPWFEKTVQWCQDVRREDRMLKQYQVPQKSRQASNPPEQKLLLSEVHYLRRVAIPPEALVNRRTAAWYLDDLARQSYEDLFLCRAASGDWAGARECAVILPELCPVYQKAGGDGYPSVDYRLQQSCDNRKFLADEEETRRFPSDLRLPLFYAELCFIQERFGDAELRLKGLLAKARTLGDPDSAATILCDLGTVFDLGHPGNRAVLDIYRQAISEAPKSAASARARMRLAILLSHFAPVDDETRRQRLQLYADAFDLAKARAVRIAAANGSLSLLVHAGREKEAQDWLRKLRQLDPQGDWDTRYQEMCRRAADWRAKHP